MSALQRRLSVGILRQAAIGFVVLIVSQIACAGADTGLVLPNDSDDPVPDNFELLIRFAHISDTQVIDEESPARFTPADSLISTAWRPQEAYSTQLLDGVIRAINRAHQRSGGVGFVIHTGDATENNQANELRWFLDILDGYSVDPTAPSGQPGPSFMPERTTRTTPTRPCSPSP